MCPRAYTVRPHVYIRTVPSSDGANSSSRRLRVLYRRMRVASAQRPGRVEDAATALAHADGDLAVSGAKLDVVLAGRGVPAPDARAQVVAEDGRGIGRAAHVLEHGGRQAAKHLVLVMVHRQPQHEEELVIGHVAEFYSERWLNSIRARAQSAAIWALSRSIDSNARSSRRRWTKPTRMRDP